MGDERHKAEAEDEFGQCSEASSTLDRQALYQALFDSATDAITVLDLQGCILECNEGTARLAGKPRAELIGSSFFDLPIMDSSKLDEMARIFSSILAGETVPPITVAIHAADGTVAWTESYPALVRFQGDVTAIQVVTRDVTERKRALDAELSLKEQLDHSRKLEAIGRLAGGVAHDFNNLLTTIDGNSQLCLMDLDADSSMREYLEDVRTAVKRASSLTRQLLAFGRKQILEPKLIDLNQILGNMRKMLGRLIGEDIKVVVNLGGQPLSIFADESQVVQIVVNLVANAREAMPDGGELTIGTQSVEVGSEDLGDHPHANPGRFIRLSLSDSGVGIHREELGRIFDPFYSTKDRARGVGLGLSTVYGIISQHEGFISVDSAPGGGTTFHVHFPLADESSVQASTEEELGFLGGEEAILLVEDDDAVRGMTRRVLERLGYSVVEAESGEQAIALVEKDESKFDLVLTDVIMPGINGRQLAISLENSLPDAPVVYMSGYPDEVIAHHGVLDKGLNFIAKPFSPRGLAKKIRLVFDHKTKP